MQLKWKLQEPNSPKDEGKKHVKDPFPLFHSGGIVAWTQMTWTSKWLINVPALCGPPPGWILGWIIGYPGIFPINNGWPEILPCLGPTILTSAQFMYNSRLPIALIHVQVKVHLSQLGKLGGNLTGQSNPSKIKIL